MSLLMQSVIFKDWFQDYLKFLIILILWTIRSALLFIEVIKTVIKLLLLRFQYLNLGSEIIHQLVSSPWLILVFSSIKHDNWWRRAPTIYLAILHYNETAQKMALFNVFWEMCTDCICPMWLHPLGYEASHFSFQVIYNLQSMFAFFPSVSISKALFTYIGTFLS